MSPRHKRPWGRLIRENTLLAFESLFDRWFRSLLTVMGVFIGVVIIIGVASVLNGFRASIVEDFEQWGTSNIYVSRVPGMTPHHKRDEFRRRKEFTLDDMEAIRDECSAIDVISADLGSAPQSTTKVRYRDRDMIGPQLRGYFPDMARVRNVELVAGRIASEEETRHRAPVCVIGDNVVKALFPNERALDKEITVNGRSFRVIGVIKKFRDAPFGGENPDDSFVLISYYTFREMFPWKRDHFIAARAKTDRLDEAIEQIEEVLRRRRRVAWGDENDFDISTTASMIETFDKIMFAALATMFSLSTVAFIVGGVGVMNVMFASVKERTREIGIRRAIGARRRDVIWQFLTEAMALTGVGGILGVLAGEAIMRALDHYVTVLPVDIPMWARLFGFFGSVGVGLFFGILPALSAARVDPIVALRYE